MGIWGPSRIEIEIHNAPTREPSPGEPLGGTVERITDKPSGVDASLSAEDSWVRAAVGRRNLVQAGIPELVRQPTFPPLPRLVLTLWRFGWAFLSWNIFDLSLIHI